MDKGFIYKNCEQLFKYINQNEDGIIEVKQSGTGKCKNQDISKLELILKRIDAECN
jgi:hypothetical protein